MESETRDFCRSSAQVPDCVRAPHTKNPVLQGTGFLRGATLFHPDVSGRRIGTSLRCSHCTQCVHLACNGAYRQLLPPLVFKGSGCGSRVHSIPTSDAGFHLIRLSVASLGMYYSRS